MAERINETLWTASVGDQFASLFYATIQPKTGWVKFVAAGHVYASLIGEERTELPSGDTLPLGTQVRQLAVSGDWRRVWVPEIGATGWMFNSLFE